MTADDTAMPVARIETTAARIEDVWTEYADSDVIEAADTAVTALRDLAAKIQAMGT